LLSEEGNVDNNPILSFVKVVILPITSLTNGSTEFVINRAEKFGGPIIYKSYDEIHEAFKEKQLHPGDLKKGAIDAINALLEPIRQKFTDPDLVQLTNSAYPPPPAKVYVLLLYQFKLKNIF
jgi:tyrosyl-tRNA synthetase